MRGFKQQACSCHEVSAGPCVSRGVSLDPARALTGGSRWTVDVWMDLDSMERPDKCCGGAGGVTLGNFEKKGHLELRFEGGPRIRRRRRRAFQVEGAAHTKAGWGQVTVCCALCPLCVALDSEAGGPAGLGLGGQPW